MSFSSGLYSSHPVLECCVNFLQGTVSDVREIRHLESSLLKASQSVLLKDKDGGVGTRIGEVEMSGITDTWSLVVKGPGKRE